MSPLNKDKNIEKMQLFFSFDTMHDPPLFSEPFLSSFSGKTGFTFEQAHPGRGRKGLHDRHRHRPGGAEQGQAGQGVRTGKNRIWFGKATWGASGRVTVTHVEI